MSLKGKILLLLIIAIAALAAVTWGNYYLRGQMVDIQNLAQGVSRVLLDMERSRVIAGTYLREGQPGQAQEASRLLASARQSLSDLAGRVDDAALAKSLGQLSKLGQAYQQIMGQTFAVVAQVGKVRTRILDTGQQLTQVARKEVVAFLDEKEGEMLTDTGESLDTYHASFRAGVKETAASFTSLVLNVQGLFLANDEKQYQADRKAALEVIKLSQTNTQTFLPNLKFPNLKESWSKITGLNQSLTRDEKELYSLWRRQRELLGQMESKAGDLIKMALAMEKGARREAADSARLADRLGLAVSLGAALLLAAWGLLMLRNTFKSLRGAVMGLRQAVGNVQEASQHLSSSSSEMASSSSQLAASLEETSSSLEEQASMTRVSADNAQETKQLMNQAVDVMGQANKDMEGLRQAMAKISANSDQTAVIVKSIDEIAFQTNLLALNAAVEAARAGEAGAGFAVVAEEVRNLAQRAAEAAQSTQELIEQNIKDVRQGESILQSTDQTFGRVDETARRAGELVSQIAEASSEQAIGIEQINRATTEMDRVTQNVAGNAERNATASQALSGLSETLDGVVGDLLKVIGASGRTGEPEAAAPSPSSPAEPPRLE